VAVLILLLFLLLLVAHVLLTWKTNTLKALQLLVFYMQLTLPTNSCPQQQKHHKLWVWLVGCWVGLGCLCLFLRLVLLLLIAVTAQVVVVVG
jgi:hypothetical protein